MKKVKNISKIGFIFIILIFSLASISYTYAGWTDNIYVNGYLETWEEPASISDYVWLDLDQDGLQDPGEPGVPGVTVNLYSGDGTFIGTTVTNETGYYIFDNLAPGKYYVEFIPPTNYFFTNPNSGTNDFIDSDADPNTGQTSVTTIVPEEDDTSWDAGLWTIYEGCSHGFWKNHPQHWQDYTPGQKVGDIFTLPLSLSVLSDDTLMTALGYGGGNDLVGAAKILLRNAVASLLNANHDDVFYPLTENEVINQVNSALSSENRDTILNFEIVLNLYNNLGSCLCN